MAPLSRSTPLALGCALAGALLLGGCGLFQSTQTAARPAPAPEPDFADSTLFVTGVGDRLGTAMYLQRTVARNTPAEPLPLTTVSVPVNP